jgi:ribosomal-protein-alanine N-acetyltransferase
MKNNLIRPANIHDLESLVNLERASFTSDVLSKKNFRHLLSVSSAEVLVAVAKQEIIGSLVLLFRKNSQKARLYSLAVEQQHRTQGIAQKLCLHMETSATSRCCQHILLEVSTQNKAAIQFYLKQGYTVFAERKFFYEDGEPCTAHAKNHCHS